MVGKQSNFEFGKAAGIGKTAQFGEVSEPGAAGIEPSGAAISTPPMGPPVAAVPRSGGRSARWFLLGLGICCLLGGISSAAFWWLTTPPPSPDCQKISPLSTDMERLLCAQEAARSGDLPKILAGLEMLGQWPPEHPLYRESQRLVAEWSDPVLTAARKKVDQSDLRGAVELASRIPPSSPLHKEAQTAIAHWRKFWQKGEAIATAARNAMKIQNWTLAAEKIELLRDFSQDYWRLDRATALSQKLVVEQQGRKVLAQARTTAKSGQSEQLAAAIALVSQMDSRTYAWGAAQPHLKQWSESLLSRGLQNWLKGNLNDAITLATPVLKNPSLAPAAQDLLWLSQGRKHALGGATTLKPTLPQVWNLSAALSTAFQIQPGSRYYRLAQASLKSWEAQFQDLILLQVAWFIGDLPHPLAKQIAMLQANQVLQDRPRRAQAQTLLAYWNLAIQRSQDQPYLTYAQTLANRETIPALRQAIAQANLVGTGRPLQLQARSLITAWNLKIQALEDRPILNRAWALANQGNLTQAMLAAATVHPGRALYVEAQTAIAQWQAQIHAAELARKRAQEEELERLLKPRPESQEGTSPLARPGDGSSPFDSGPESGAFPSPSGLNPAPGSRSGAPGNALPPVYEPAPPVPELPPPVYEPYEPPPPPPRAP